MPACPGEVPVAALEQADELLELPTVDMLTEWAARAFTDVSGGRMELPVLTAAYQSTNGLLINAKEALRLLSARLGSIFQRAHDRCSASGIARGGGDQHPGGPGAGRQLPRASGGAQPPRELELGPFLPHPMRG